MRRLGIAVVLATLGVCLFATSATAAVPRSFFGMGTWGAPTASQFNRLHRAGVGGVRSDLSWWAVEPRPGVRDWSAYDVIVRNAARARIRMLPTILSSPPFAASQSNYPPSSASARSRYAQFLRDAAARYGPGGSFWRANPGLPQRPIKDWQIWNEPSLPFFWNGHPDARDYASFLRISRGALRSVDGHARIVLAGMPEVGNGIAMSEFLRQLYAAGARDLFDVVALHPYSRDQRGVIRTVVRVRRIMRAGGDRRKPIRITEIGWGTAGDPGGTHFRTSQRGQANRLRKMYKTLIKRRRRYHVDGIYWFALVDRAPRAGEDDFWGLHSGLLFANGKAKPAWRTFVRIAKPKKKKRRKHHH